MSEPTLPTTGRAWHLEARPVGHADAVGVGKMVVRL